MDEWTAPESLVDFARAHETSKGKLFKSNAVLQLLPILFYFEDDKDLIECALCEFDSQFQ